LDFAVFLIRLLLRFCLARVVLDEICEDFAALYKAFAAAAAAAAGLLDLCGFVWICLEFSALYKAFA
jgi:hypothetical protein